MKFFLVYIVFVFSTIIVKAQFFDWVVDKEKALNLGVLVGEYLGNYGTSYAMSKEIKKNENDIRANMLAVLASHTAYFESLKETKNLKTASGSVKEIIGLAQNNIELFKSIEYRCVDMKLGNISDIIGSEYFLQLTTEMWNMIDVVKKVIISKEKDNLMRYDERVQLLYHTKKSLLKTQLLLNTILNHLDMLYTYGVVSKDRKKFGIREEDAIQLAKQTINDFNYHVK